MASNMPNLLTLSSLTGGADIKTADTLFRQTYGLIVPPILQQVFWKLPLCRLSQI